VDISPEFRQDRIVFEDDDLIVVDKPPFVPCQAAEQERDDDLPARLRRFLAARRGVPESEVYLGTHQRLDQATSGLVLYTLRREANASIAAQFESRSIGKLYVAGVTGLVRYQGERTLVHELLRASGGRMQVVERATPGSRRAQTRLAQAERCGDRALVSLHCDTGRTHQLRVQLAHVGAPIAGDDWYGGAQAMRLMLHATELRLAHPTDGRPLLLRAPLPIELRDWLQHGARDVSADPDLLSRALELAIEKRYRVLRERRAAAPTTACRLFHQEADGDAGLAVDLYGEHLVAHLFSETIEAREPHVLDTLHALGCAGVYVKRHPVQKSTLVDPRDERFAPAGPVRGVPAPEENVIREHGMPFEVKLGEGLRTGIFLDQRDNRHRIAELARGKRVLNLFAYTGGFSIAALAGGAEHALCVDVSGAALQWAQRGAARVGAAERHRVMRTDATDALRRIAKRGESFDVIVLDPPSFSTTRGARLQVMRDYEALVRSCLAVLAPHGVLLACVNHHGASQVWLRKQVQAAARSLGREIARIDDLPTQVDFPAAMGREPTSKSVLVRCA
jgi:23S rRNA (cytosine1962-C5)-methyltransferase